MMVMVIMMMVVEEGSTRHTYEGNGDVMMLAQRLGLGNTVMGECVVIPSLVSPTLTIHS